jgi:hypothetical protein
MSTREEIDMVDTKEAMEILLNACRDWLTLFDVDPDDVEDLIGVSLARVRVAYKFMKEGK